MWAVTSSVSQASRMMKALKERNLLSETFTCFLQMHVMSLTLWRTVHLKSRTSYECGLVL